MKILNGNKIIEITHTELMDRIQGFKKVIFDIGTGDGEFVYRKAKTNPDTIYIGIDSSVDGMVENAVRASKKPQKGGLNNALYIISNAYALPQQLNGIADEIYINLPWGSLRDGMIKGDDALLENIRKVSKPNAVLHITITYSDLYEKNQIELRQLPDLTMDYFKSSLVWKYREHGLNIKDIKILDNEALKKLDTKWSKKLGFGRRREVFFINCSIQSLI